jgi:TRAP-type C4-dicarboxylate transport system permease small subunit
MEGSFMNVEKALGQPRTMFSVIEKGIQFIATALVYASIFLFVVLMFFDTADVIGRKFFNSPIIGTMEISQVLMGGVVLLGWAYTQRLKGHVNVDMFITRYSPRARAAVDMAMLFLSLVLFAAITYASFVLAMQYVGQGRVFPTLRVTSVPFYFFVPVGGFFMCLEFIVEIIKLAPKLRKRG